MNNLIFAGIVCFLFAVLMSSIGRSRKYTHYLMREEEPIDFIVLDKISSGVAQHHFTELGIWREGDRIEVEYERRV